MTYFQNYMSKYEHEARDDLFCHMRLWELRIYNPHAIMNAEEVVPIHFHITGESDLVELISH